MNSEVKVVFEVKNELGEGPLWDVAEQTLHWVDVEGNALYRYRPAQESHFEKFEFDFAVTSLALREQGGYILATQQGLCFWDGQSLDLIVHPEAGKPNARFNDSKADRQGRFWSGTTAEDFTGVLYRLDTQLNLQKMETGIGVSNGIGWSLDNQQMYYCDSGRKCIYVYAFNPEDGSLSDRRILVDNSNEDNTPDGLTVDSEGYIWSPHWGGWKVCRYAPDGSLDREIAMPVQHPTSCSFGDADLRTLYITSARVPLDAKQREEQPLAGSLFSIRTEVSGVPEERFGG